LISFHIQKKNKNNNNYINALNCIFVCIYFFYIDADSSAVSNITDVDIKNHSISTPSYAQTLKTKKDTDTAELKTIFPVASWD